MSDELPPEREAVFIAANVGEAELIERILEEQGIEFEVTPEAFLRIPTTNVCYQGLLFEVLGGQAEYCRFLFRRAGLARGLVPPEE